MQTNGSVDAEMESLSMQCDEVEFPKIVQFVLVTVARLFSIFSCYVMIHFILKHRPIRNKVNTLMAHLCIIISINFLYATAYQFFRWKNTILPIEIFEILQFTYFILYISVVTSVFMLPLFWFLFLTLKTVFKRFDVLILLGLLPPYITPSVFIYLFWKINHINLQKFYYYFIIFYCGTLILTFLILIYFMLLKLEDRLKKNKLDYLLYSGTTVLISMLPEILCFTFELYFFDERGPLYYEVYYVDFSVDFIRSVCPFFVFAWIVASNKYFRKAFKNSFSKEQFKHIFRVKKASVEQSSEDDDILDMKLNLNEVFL